MSKEFNLVVRVAAENILNFYENKNSIFVYELNFKKKTLNHVYYGDITNTINLEEQAHSFLKIWQKNKRYIQNCYRRESSEKISNLEIRNIAELHYIKITNFLKNSRVSLIVFEENPHIFMDVMIYLAGVDANVKCIFHEFFFQNSILCQTEVHNKKKLTKVLNFFSVFEGSQSQLWSIKLVHFIKKNLAYIFGGGIRWNSIVITKGKYVDISFYSKIVLSITRENALIRYKRLIQKLKSICDGDLNEKDLVIFFHVQPESSTSPYGDIYSDQIYSCYALAKKYPNRKIIIKEHPALFKRNEKKPLTIYSFRNERLLKRLINIPNIYYGNGEFLKSKSWVVSINGTILKERSNLKLKSLVLNNPSIIDFCGKSTWFMNNLRIVSRGSQVIDTTSNPKFVRSANLGLDKI